MHIKRLLFLAVLSALPLAAQIPAPQINLTGNIGCVGFPCLNSGTLIMSADADRAMTSIETSAFYLKVTSSVSLTATRNLISPSGNFPYTIENATTGGQSIQIIGQSGTGVTIPNGQTISVWFDGTNFVQVGSPGGGTPGGSNTDVQYNNSGAFGGYPLTNFILSTGNQTITYNTNGASTLTIANPNAGSSAASGYLASNGTDFFALELAGTGTSIPGAGSFVLSNATAPLAFQTGGGPILFNAPNTNISGALNYAADTGSANAYVVAPPSCVSATHAGTTINFKAANASTGASTLVYCTGSPVTLEKNGSTALTTGDILAGAQYSARYDGTNWQLLNSSLTGGGSSLPTAPTGSIITNTSGSTTYAGQANIFYQQSGDTIASIETACSSACTYVVTSPQTITLAASHSLSANVNLRFEADGSWTVNGSTFVLTIPGQISGTLTQHFVAGTGSVKLGVQNYKVPVEWFGAIGDWNGTSGTDNTTPIQNTLTALTNGCALLGPVAYKTTAALSITTSYVGVCSNEGFNASLNGVPPTASATIISTSASADIIDVSSTTGTTFKNFNLFRSVAPSGTATGLKATNVYGLRVDTVSSEDSVRLFYINGCSGSSVDGFNNVNGGWGYNGFIETAGGPFYGVYVDSSTGNASASFIFRNVNIAGLQLANAVQTYGQILIGTAVNDIDTYNFATAGVTFGQVVTFSGSSTIGAGDIHFISSTHDQFYTSAFQFNNMPSTGQASVTVLDARVATANSSGKGIDCETSDGINITASQIDGSTLADGISATGCTDMVISANSFFRVNTGVLFATSTNSTIIGNNFGATLVTGINLGSGSNNNSGLQLNSFASGITTNISDSGTGNQALTMNTFTANTSMASPIVTVGTYLTEYAGSSTSPATTSIRAVSTGNLNINAYSTGRLQFNYDSGTNGAYFFNGAGVVTADIDPSGNIQVGSGSTTVIPATATGSAGAATGKVQLTLSGTTATITGTALTATCDSGTASVTGAVVGHPVEVSSTTGADVGGAFYLRGSVTSTNTVTVYVCGTGTPSSLAYNVVVF